jgi:hypothetical protein
MIARKIDFCAPMPGCAAPVATMLLPRRKFSAGDKNDEGRAALA